MSNPLQSNPIQNQWIKKTQEAPVDTVSPEKWCSSGVGGCDG